MTLTSADSGNPFWFATRAIAFYDNDRIDKTDFEYSSILGVILNILSIFYNGEDNDTITNDFRDFIDQSFKERGNDHVPALRKALRTISSSKPQCYSDCFQAIRGGLAHKNDNRNNDNGRANTAFNTSELNEIESVTISSRHLTTMGFPKGLSLGINDLKDIYKLLKDAVKQLEQKHKSGQTKIATT